MYFLKPFLKAGDEAARKVLCTAFKPGWLPSVLVQNACSFLINEDSAVTTWVCACSLKRGACFQRHSKWRRTFKCYFMQLPAWHGAQVFWVEVIISLKCLGGLHILLPEAQKAPSIPLTKALALHYSHWRSVDLRIKHSNRWSLHSHMSGTIQSKNRINHNNVKREV